jgi:hypothetical protein
MAGGGGGKGGKGGGGGSGSIDVTSTSTSTIDSDSTSTINSTSTSTLNSTSNSNNQIDSKANAQLEVVGLDNIRLKADTTADNKTALEMDLKPLQLDFCFKVGLERFPSTKICKPQSQHFGLTVLGVEVIGFNYSSDSTTVIEDLGNRPVVVATAGPLGQQPAPHYHQGSGPHYGGPGPGGQQGLRIRIP